MKIALASDHRGFKLKAKLIRYLQKKNYEIIDLGTYSEESTDYPIYGFKIGQTVADKEADYGIAICGSGIGISIACNKVKGVRCAKVSNTKEAYLTRIDNDANILALSSKTMYIRALDIIDTFLETTHPYSERHDRRIDMIKEYEEENYKISKKKVKKEKEEEHEC